MDLRAVFEGRAAPPAGRALAYYQGGTIKAVRRGDWKLVLAGEGYQKDLLDIGWPAAFPDYPLALYNLRDDPSESNNLADARPEIVASLQEEIAAIRARVPGPATPIGPLRRPELGIPPNLEGLKAPNNPSRRYRNEEIERRRAELEKVQ
jgi:arylsulfatase A-like enzyme